MKQLILNIPDNKYMAFIRHMRQQFSDIQIKEKGSAIEPNQVHEEDVIYNTTFLSEGSLSEDWLSEEDNRWDDVL